MRARCIAGASGKRGRGLAGAGVKMVPTVRRALNQKNT